MRKNAQSTLEYMVLISVIVAGLFAMQVYIKRAIQGKMREQADQVSNGLAYSPGATSGDYMMRRNISSNSISSTERVGTTDASRSESFSNMQQIVVQSQNVLSFGEEPAR
jgi:hypothetical protein